MAYMLVHPSHVSRKKLLKAVREPLGAVLRMTSQEDDGGETELRVKINTEECRQFAHELQDIKNWLDNDLKPGFWRQTLSEYLFIKILRALERAKALVTECCDVESNLMKLAIVQASGNQDIFLDMLQDVRLVWARLSRRLEDLESQSTHDRNNFDDAGKRDRKDLKKKLEKFVSDGAYNAQQLGSLRNQLLQKVKGMKNASNDSRSSSRSASSRLTTTLFSTYSGSSPNLKLIILDIKLVGERLGSGSYGVVYETEWFGLKCAKKVFNNQESNEGFRQEAAILSDLRHPNVVQLYFCARFRHELSLVMELMTADLGAQIDKSRSGFLSAKPFSFFVAFDIIFQIAKGLRYLHDKEIAHRDIKPRNILVSPSPVTYLAQRGYFDVKLADFGLAKVKLSSTSELQTKNVGTPAYWAPEVISDEEIREDGIHYHPLQADVYSFGITCSEILTGKRPFGSGDRGTLRKRIIDGERPCLPLSVFSSHERKLHVLIRDCWEHDPVKRPTSNALCERLETVCMKL